MADPFNKTTEWSAERLDALPVNTVIEVRYDFEDDAYSYVKVPGKYSWAMVCDAKTFTSEAVLFDNPSSILVVSVPIYALLTAVSTVQGLGNPRPASLEEFAATWHSFPEKAPDPETGRQQGRRAQAIRYWRGVWSPQSVDNWLRKARDAGLIAEPGRPKEK